MSPKDGAFWKAEQSVIRLLKRCWSMKHLKEMQSRMLVSGFGKNPLVVGKIIEFCAVSGHGDMNYAVRVFEWIDKPDAFMWNTLMRGSGKTSQPEKAIDLYKRMQRKGDATPDTFTSSFILKIIAGLGSLTLGNQLHCTILKLGLETHTHVSNSLMHMYGMVKDIQTAHHLFDEILNPDLVAWNSIIHSHVHCRNYKEALHLFTRMLQSGIQPDNATLVVTLSACGAIVALDFGRQIHSLIRHTKLGESTPLSNSLIDMYAKCGAVEEAYHIFSNMKRKDVISWNVMILGLASHGNGQEALTLFANMLQQNVERPNDVTFLGVLSACSHGGLVDESIRYIDIMSRDYNIQPTIKHYGCMVDLLGRAGLVEDAYDLIKNMPVECNAIVWRTLLAACRLHGYVELGEEGSSLGQFFKQYLEPIKLNDVKIDWKSNDLSYLLEDKYSMHFVNIVKKTIPVYGADMVLKANKDQSDFENIARLFGIFQEWKDGVPRTAYKGVIVFRYQTSCRIFLVGSEYLKLLQIEEA